MTIGVYVTAGSIILPMHWQITEKARNSSSRTTRDKDREIENCLTIIQKLIRRSKCIQQRFAKTARAHVHTHTHTDISGDILLLIMFFKHMFSLAYFGTIIKFRQCVTNYVLCSEAQPKHMRIEARIPLPTRPPKGLQRTNRRSCAWRNELVHVTNIMPNKWCKTALA